MSRRSSTHSKKTHQRRPASRPYYLLNTALSAAVLSLFSVIGIRLLQAAGAVEPSSPYGWTDSCALEGNKTVIYGWASDPNVGAGPEPSVTIAAGGKSTKVATSIAGYRDAGVNAWIDHYRAGDPKPGTYGFRAVLPGLFKGTQNTLTGTVYNVGPGETVAIYINNDHHVDGDASKPYFPGNKIPDVCLATQDPTPPPTPPPVTPPPATPPTTPPAGPHTPPTPPAAPTSDLSDAADATVTTGTLATKLHIPFGNATKIHIIYGIQGPLPLDKPTDDVATGGQDVDIILPKLLPLSTYSYEVVRSDDSGKVTTSTSNSFKTKGYTITVHFVDAKNKPVKGIPTSIASIKAKTISGTDGKATFKDTVEGTYSIQFTYSGKSYKETAILKAATLEAETGAPVVVTREFTVNVDKLAVAKPQTKTNHWWLIPLLIGLVLLGFGIWWIFFRKKLRDNSTDYTYDSDQSLVVPPPPVHHSHHATPPPTVTPAPLTPVPPLINPNTQSSFAKNTPHMGESLKDMVLRSMAEEAKRRQEAAAPDNKDDPRP